MAAVSARERELLEESLHALLVLGDIGVSLTPDTFEVEVRDETRSTVAGTRNDKRIETVLLDHAVEVNVSAIGQCLAIANVSQEVE